MTFLETICGSGTIVDEYGETREFIRDGLAAQKRMTDLAWAAGFLDGEGCFTLIKQSGATLPSQRSLYVGASQSTREPLEKLQELFGGKLNIRSRPTDKGTIMHVWLLGQRAAVVQEFIPQVLPYLIVKKREAEILLEFAATVRRRGRPKRGVTDFTSQEEIDTRMRLIAEMDTIRGRSAVEVVISG